MAMNDKSEPIHPLLAGCRQTRTRQGVLAILRDAKPLAAPMILTRLRARGVSVNKTTVYRELEFLLNKKIVSELVLQDGLKRYELRSERHNHHLICLRCQAIESIVLDKDLDEQEKKIAQRRHFRVISHALEFYGLCRDCAKE
jgi:Fur family transcriptional regulator, ferric uptake regulator